MCNPDIISPADDSWKVTNPQGTCNYKYEFPTCLACEGGCSVTPGAGPGQDDGGLWGTPFLIILLVVVVLYVAGGFAYNSKFNGAAAPPNAEFWGSIPGLVKDGCVFTYGAIASVVCRSQGGGGSGTYKGMGAGDSSGTSYQNPGA